ncbi:MAG: ZIP family zinc transporter [Actinobacteria bacterium]|nr:ZIP family zinc transporter [Actinomycetota bacterium]
MLWGALGGAALLIGAAVVFWRKPSERITGMIMGFGSGTLISAIAYELIPDSTLEGGLWLAFSFLSGAIVFFVFDYIIDRMGGGNRKALSGAGSNDSGTAIFLGALLDGIPESMILGISLGLGGSVNIAFLFAVFVSNLPEGVAGTSCLKEQGYKRNRIITMWSFLLIASAVAAGLGYIFTQDIKVINGAYLQAFAAGAMLTMLADTMMPEAFKYGGKIVGLLTVAGFFVAAAISYIQ